MKKSVITMIVCVFLGAALGFGIFEFTYRVHPEGPPVSRAGAADATAVSASGSTDNRSQREYKRPEEGNKSDTDAAAGYLSIAEALRAPVGFPRYRAMYQFADSAKLEDLPGLIVQTLALQKGIDRSEFSTILLEKFVSLDPHAAFAFVKPMVDSQFSSNYFLMQRLFREWVRFDQDAALASLESIVDPQLRQSVAISVIQGSTTLSEDARTNLASTLPQSSREYLLDYQRITQQQKLPPRDAFEEALRSGDSNSLMTSVLTAVTRWINEDPLAAMERVESLSLDSGMSAMNRSLLTSVALGNWATNDFDGALAYAEISKRSAELVPEVLVQLVTTDPQKAMRLARNFDMDSEGNSQTQLKVLSRWAVTDAVEAVKFIETNGIALDQNSETRIASFFATQDPLAALEWVENKGDQTVRAVGNAFGTQHPHQAERYTAELKGGLLRDSIVQSLSQQKALTDPETALEFLSKNLTPENQSYDMAKDSIVYNWISNDVEGALDYLLESNQNIDDKYVPSVVSNWYSKDPRAALRWVEKLSDDRQRNKGWANYALAVGNQTQDFEAAIDLTNNINNPQERNTAVLQVVRAWAQREPERKNEIAQRFHFTTEQLNTPSRPIIPIQGEVMFKPVFTQ